MVHLLTLIPEKRQGIPSRLDVLGVIVAAMERICEVTGITKALVTAVTVWLLVLPIYP